MRDFTRMIAGWLNGSYRKFPWRSSFVLLLVGIYAINPFDIIPDFIPFFGVIDDAAMLGFLVRSLMKDVEKFRDWEQQQVHETTPDRSSPRSGPDIVDAEFEDLSEEKRRLKK